MEYRRLGKSGLRVSALSLGSWVTFGAQIKDGVASQLMDIAYDAGVNFFDNAEAYAAGQSEIVMGELLKQKGWGRDTWCVSSKVYWGGQQATQKGLSRKHIHDACHAALKRLQVDYLDLFFCHRPDRHTPIEETVAAMSDLIRQGKILYWGTSEWTARDIMAAHAAANARNDYAPTMEQAQYHMFHRERFEVDYSRIYTDYGLGTTTWSPLASGLLSGKYCEGRPGDTRLSLEGYDWLREKFEGPLFEERLEKIKSLMALANEIGITMPQLGVAWCLKNPNVSTVILGASKTEQLSENLKAVELYDKITDEVDAKIEAILANKPEAEIDF